jgi:hypothetical protein
MDKTKLAALANATPMELLRGDLQIVAANFERAQNELESVAGRRSWLDAPVAIAKDRAANPLPEKNDLVSKHFADKQIAAAVVLRLALEGRAFEYKPAGDGVSIEFSAADASLVAEAGAPVFALIQEGGSSSELYLHAHSSEEEALEDRYSCTEEGSYRTSTVVELPPAVAALGEMFYEAAEVLLQASNDLECAERPSMGPR